MSWCACVRGPSRDGGSAAANGSSREVSDLEKESGRSGVGFSAGDRLFMRIAIGQAARGLGRTSPNPAVGAVVARRREILSMGYHTRAGGPHAERVALEPLKGRDLGDATLYVNLEPCCHYGATPPCTELILERGVGRVVAAIADPNPVVSGKGVEALRRGGVKVELGLMAEEASRLNEAYLTRVTLGRPLVVVKMAVTADGRIADKNGRSKWITEVKSRKYSHYLRSKSDAVLVGARTAAADDPRLDVRLVKGGDPLAIVVDPDLGSLRPGLRLLDRAPGRTVYICSQDRPQRRAEQALRRGVRLWEVPARDGVLDPAVFLRVAAQNGISSVMVEGGAETVTALMRAGLVDKLYLFTAPRLVGAGLSWLGDAGFRGLEDGPALRRVRARKVGRDLLYTAYLDWGERGGAAT